MELKPVSTWESYVLSNRSVLVVVAATALAAFGGLMVGCSTAAPASQPAARPTISITSPASGEVVTGSGLTVRWTASGMEVKPATEATRKEQAHFHVFVDKSPELHGTEPWGADVIHTGGYEQQLGLLQPGTHTVWVAAGFMDHTPYVPYAVDSATFVVR